MTPLEWLPPPTNALIAGFVLIVAVCAHRVARHLRLHHPLSNRKFLRQYRVQRPQNRRTTVEAPPPAPPVVRPSHHPVTKPVASAQNVGSAVSAERTA